jgi:hypothetical protein
LAGLGTNPQKQTSTNFGWLSVLAIFAWPRRWQSVDVSFRRPIGNLEGVKGIWKEVLQRSFGNINKPFDFGRDIFIYFSIEMSKNSQCLRECPSGKLVCYRW